MIDKSLEEILKLLDGFIIFSRKYNKFIKVSDGKFYDSNGNEFISNPSKEEVDKLCDDMFFEEFGVEPTDDNILKAFAEVFFDIGNETLN